MEALCGGPLEGIVREVYIWNVNNSRGGIHEGVILVVQVVGDIHKEGMNECLV